VAELVHSIGAALRGGGSVAIHCRAGIGGSGLIAGCVLVAQGLPRAEAFPRVSRARGFDVPDTDAQIAWLEKFAREAKNPSSGRRIITSLG
jgi:protein-tyrosine phosphatase